MTELFKYVTMDLVKSVWHLWPSTLFCWVLSISNAQGADLKWMCCNFTSND